MKISKLIICEMFRLAMAAVILEPEINVSDVSIGLSQIVKSINPNQLAILVRPHHTLNASLTEHNSRQVAEENHSLQIHIDEFLQYLHELNIKSVIFYDAELFFKFIESSLKVSIESVNLILLKPYDLMQKIHDRKLTHRLSLFIFYWGAKYPPKRSEVNFREPMRAVVITRPRKRAFRIYYNQAYPDGLGHLALVSWYDGDNLGLSREPLLPSSKSVYSNFQGRVFRVPVFHSPPWFWVNYDNDSYTNNSLEFSLSEESLLTEDMPEYKEINVTGGRDHRLLQLLAQHMNFEFVYIEAHGRTQGSLRTDDDANDTFTGGIGMLQIGLADFFLGDVSLSWERRKAIEFSFFTLADSGAFATHAPRRLNEALAILRPFKADVWPYLVLTVIVSGPVFYFVIVAPYFWHPSASVKRRPKKITKMATFHMCYIKEITRIDTQFQRRLAKMELHASLGNELEELPPNLFNRCIWFTVQLFLKQSCQELYHGYRTKFLMIVYWIAATYVLADVYSAQLTSQFARPAREPPINTLQRLQAVMIHNGYQLFVEKESTSLEMLENGTEVFRQLYALMKLQSPDMEGYLIDSVEAGMKLIADGLENKAVLGGRETLYFNIHQYGSKTFQLSHKLYTRYSAVAVQIGCPFLDSLNDVLIHLFESGILDKMTTAEYETQSRMLGKDMNKKTKNKINDMPAETTSSEESNTSNEANGKSAGNSEMKKPQDTPVIQPINLCMLQGAFIVLFVGYTLAGLMLLLELFCHGMNLNVIRVWKRNLYRKCKISKRNLRKSCRWMARRFK